MFPKPKPKLKNIRALQIILRCPVFVKIFSIFAVETFRIQNIMGNYIRFDWMIKRLLRNKSNFVVLEGFLI